MTNITIDRTWYPVPQGCGICPCCNGTGLVELTDKEKSYSWYKDKTHRQCGNCGGQTMGGKALGYTKLDPETGLGCNHSYTEKTVGRCYHQHTCKKCGHQFYIDSGD